ncbi:hypothetical protein HDU86_006714 [Geranomyces michiganensis]|nr:hypothetical protein HDU86_006714 [Geranomyces michiganensis]
MKFASSAALLAACAAAVSAQITHEVAVAPGKTLTYSPPSLQIAIGDTVKFTWQGGPHTVTQMGLNGDPCAPLPGGIDSAKQNATATLGLKFNTAGKRLFGCTVGKHCTSGMQLAVDVLAAGATPAATGAPAASSAAAPAATSTAAGGAAYPPTASTTPAAGGAAGATKGTGTQADPIIVTVGDGGLTFTPKDITVKTGSWVQWNFASGPHNVKQVAKAGTCDVQAGGFATPANLMAGGTFMQQFTTPGVNSYVCTVGQHCQKGMVGSVTVSDTGIAAPGGAGAAVAPTTHTILVGQGGLTFTPATLAINQGDTVNWQFLGTHNVKQTATADSCDPMAGGFASANVDAGGSFNRTFTTETGKIWYVCTYQGHCGQGMKALITVNAAGAAGANGTAAPPAAAQSSAPAGIQSQAPFVAVFAALLAGSMLVL